MDGASTPVLDVRGLCKSYGAVSALSDIDLAVHAGEVVALVGDNGAGKSTLVKAISGTDPADRGTILFQGRPVSLATPQQATALGIATIYQDLALCGNLDVVSNLFLAREITAAGVLDDVRMEAQARRILQDLSVTTINSLRTPVSELSGGQRQAVAIARIMLGTPRIILFDEPTAALGVAQTQQVIDLIGRLRDQGMGVVLITHNLADVFLVSDRIEVLRLGRSAGSFRTPQCSKGDIVTAIMGGRSAA